MGWNPKYRYKLLGKVIRSGCDYLILFNLNDTEVYQRIENDGEKPKASRTPVFPSQWQNQFGLPVEEHQKLLNVNLIDGYTIIGLERERNTVIEDLSDDVGGDKYD